MMSPQSLSGGRISKRKKILLRQNNYCPVEGEALISLYAENQDTFKTQAQSRLHETGSAG
jgi:hypothetical protein